MTPKVMYPPTWFLLAVLAMLVLHHITTRDQVIPVPFAPVGLAIIGVGLALGLWAIACFRRVNTPAKPFEPMTTLVIAGPYRFSRNPMYLGLAIMLLGLALYLGSLLPFFVIPLFVWVIMRRFIRREETLLRERFGEVYDRYKAGVRCWL